MLILTTVTSIVSPSFTCIVKIRILNEQKSVVDGIAEKDPGKGFCDDALDPQCLDDLRSLLPGGTAAKVLAGNDDVAFLGSVRPVPGEAEKRRKVSYLRRFSVPGTRWE